MKQTNERITDDSCLKYFSFYLCDMNYPNEIFWSSGQKVVESMKPDIIYYLELKGDTVH